MVTLHGPYHGGGGRVVDACDDGLSHRHHSRNSGARLRRNGRPNVRANTARWAARDTYRRSPLLEDLGNGLAGANGGPNLAIASTLETDDPVKVSLHAPPSNADTGTHREVCGKQTSGRVLLTHRRFPSTRVAPIAVAITSCVRCGRGRGRVAPARAVRKPRTPHHARIRIRRRARGSGGPGCDAAGCEPTLRCVPSARPRRVAKVRGSARAG